MEASVSDKNRKEDARASERAKRDAEREEKEAERIAAEEARRLAEQQKRTEEFDEWKNTFSVSDSGEQNNRNNSDDNATDLLSQMIKYIQKKKIAPIDQIASKFNMRTADALSRIQALHAEGILTGIFDERGRYIYVSKQEMLEIREKIKLKGRINVEQLVKICNQIITIDDNVDDEDDEKQTITT